MASYTSIKDILTQFNSRVVQKEISDATKTQAVSSATSTADGLVKAYDVKTYIDGKVAGASNYLGTVTAKTGLSTSAKKGDFYRAASTFDGVHVGDILIAEKNNPAQLIDSTNWTLLHNELDTDTTYTISQESSNPHIVTLTPSSGKAQYIVTADTTNTAGATNTVDKIYLVGSRSQVGSAQTYSNVNVYAQNGILYSNGLAVASSNDVSAVETALNKFKTKVGDDYQEKTGNLTRLITVLNGSQTGLLKMTAGDSSSGNIFSIDTNNYLTTEHNQKVKAGSITFGADDVIDIVAGSNVTVTGDATNKKITISSSYTNTNQTIKCGTTTFGANDAVAIVGGTNITLTPDATHKQITITATDTTYGADRGISLSNGKFGHSNTAVTAKTAYGSTSTTINTAGQITLTDVKYDSYGHITASTDRTITILSITDTDLDAIYNATKA